MARELANADRVNRDPEPG